MSREYRTILEILYSDDEIRHILVENLKFKSAANARENLEILWGRDSIDICLNEDMRIDETRGYYVINVVRLTNLETLDELVEYCENNNIEISDDRYFGNYILVGEEKNLVLDSELYIQE